MALLEYKGYLGSIEPQIESQSLFGRLVYIRDVVTYEASTLGALEHEFKASVDAYLDSCKELGKEPNRPFKGSFNVRTGPDLHRAAVLAAKDQSLNAFVCQAIEEKVARQAG